MELVKVCLEVGIKGALLFGIHKQLLGGIQMTVVKQDFRLRQVTLDLLADGDATRRSPFTVNGKTDVGVYLQGCKIGFVGLGPLP